MGVPRALRRRAAAGRQRHPSAPRRPVATPDPNATPRWRERRWFAYTVRFVVFALPIVLSFLVALWLSRLLPVPEPFGARLMRWLGIAVVSTVVLMAAQRMLRHMLPLSALLSLTLVFPDAAPSRFRIALRSMSARGLERSLRAADTPAADTPQEAAERLLVLVGALSRHDRLTRGHSERVRAYSLMIGEEMGLNPPELDRLRWAGLLHDIGKLHVPSEILNKPGRLTDEEFATVREHTIHGARLTEGLRGWLGADVDAVDQHHERWAGGGYPYGLRGRSITRSARIVSVADAFDVMTSARSYKKPISAASARSELERCVGSQFDPDVVRAMLNISLGTLWRAMGPLAWAAQLRLFPRQVAQASSPAMTSAAVAVSMAVTAVVAAIGATDRPQTADAAPLVAAVVVDQLPVPATMPPSSSSTQPASAAGSTVPPPIPSTTAPGSTAVPSTSTTTTTIAAEPAGLPVTEGPVVIVRPTTTAPPSTPNPAPALAPLPAPVAPITAATTTLPRTGPIATTTTTTTAPSTTTTTTTAPSTTTTPPEQTGAFTVGSSGAGDVVSQPVLPLGASRGPRNLHVANYDVDRNADPGLTIQRSADGLLSDDPTRVQSWALPDAVAEIPRFVIATLYVSAARAVDEGDNLRVSAGIVRCNPTRLNCDLVRSQTIGIAANTPGAFTPVTFDLSSFANSGKPTGFHFELRIAVPNGSDEDVWIAYDAADAPASITLTR